MDGRGLSDIDDPVVARALMEKVSDFNGQVGLSSLAIVAFFALLPQATASTIAILTLIFGGIYFLEGKIPVEE